VPQQPSTWSRELLRSKRKNEANRFSSIFCLGPRNGADFRDICSQVKRHWWDLQATLPPPRPSPDQGLRIWGFWASLDKFGKLFFHTAFVYLHRWVCAHVRHFHLLSKQWSFEIGLGLGFSLRAARVHTHHIYVHVTCKRHVEKGWPQILSPKLFTSFPSNADYVTDDRLYSYTVKAGCCFTYTQCTRTKLIHTTNSDTNFTLYTRSSYDLFRTTRKKWKLDIHV